MSLMEAAFTCPHMSFWYLFLNILLQMVFVNRISRSKSYRGQNAGCAKVPFKSRLGPSTANSRPIARAHDAFSKCCTLCPGRTGRMLKIEGRFCPQLACPASEVAVPCRNGCPVCGCKLKTPISPTSAPVPGMCPQITCDDPSQVRH